MTASSVSGPSIWIRSSMSWLDDDKSLMLLGKNPVFLRASVAGRTENIYNKDQTMKIKKPTLQDNHSILRVIFRRLRIEILTGQGKWHWDVSCRNDMVIFVGIDEFIRIGIVCQLILKVHVDIVVALSAAAVGIYRFCTGDGVRVYCGRGLKNIIGVMNAFLATAKVLIIFTLAFPMVAGKLEHPGMTPTPLVLVTCNRLRNVTNSVLRLFKRCCSTKLSFDDDASEESKILICFRSSAR